MTPLPLLTGAPLLSMLTLAAGADPAVMDIAHDLVGPGVSYAWPAVQAVVAVGVAALLIAMLLCFWRLWRGPSLADRVLAGDTLALQVAGLVIVLGIWLDESRFFDAALVVAILGFASTVAFAQYIGAGGGAEVASDSVASCELDDNATGSASATHHSQLDHS